MDLSVRPADAHLHGAHQELAGPGPRVRELDDLCGVNPTRRRDETEHGHAAVRPPSMTNRLPVTNAASSDAR